MILPKRLKKGDTIGVIAPSGHLREVNIDDVEKSLINMGYNVKMYESCYSVDRGYLSGKDELRAKDLQDAFEDKNIDAVFCIRGGYGAARLLDLIDFDIIKNNPKIVCGYSDITSLTNMIFSKTGLVTFSGTNFKTIATDETDYSYKEIIKRFVEGSLEIGKEKSGYKTIKDGSSEGELIGGNLSLTKGLVDGKYKIDFTDKILFLEDLGYESEPAFISNYLYYMRQNKVFDKIKGIWLGNYEHESGITLEKILLDVIENDYTFPIIKSNNFGHIETKTVIPIGTKAKIDTNKTVKIELIESCVK